MTGFSGSGKSTIAQMLKRRLDLDGHHTYVLDGDILREGINSDLGFKDIDRKESVRRAAELARLMVDAGLVVIVALISPFRADRIFARSLFENNEFFEVFIDASIEECIYRDPKGLYAKAISGQLLNFTGIDGDYQPPEFPEVHLYTSNESAEDSVDKLFKVLNQKINE
jgi:bifunctional enzyme CysN/CysC